MGTPFQQVIYEDRLRTVAGMPTWLLTVVAASAAGARASTDQLNPAVMISLTGHRPAAIFIRAAS